MFYDANVQNKNKKVDRTVLKTNTFSYGTNFYELNLPVTIYYQDGSISKYYLVPKNASELKTRIEKGEVTTFENCFPDYMRRAEAEVKLEQGALPICKGPKQE